MGIISTRRFEQNGSDGSEWAVSSGGEHYLDTVGVTSSNLVSPTICGHGSVGRAQPCQGWGRGFEPRCPLQNSQPRLCGAFSFIDLEIVRLEESFKKLRHRRPYSSLHSSKAKREVPLNCISAEPSSHTDSRGKEGVIGQRKGVMFQKVCPPELFNIGNS